VEQFRFPCKEHLSNLSGRARLDLHLALDFVLMGGAGVQKKMYASPTGFAIWPRMHPHVLRTLFLPKCTAYKFLDKSM
jgi:hypothetical protein